MKKQSFSMKTLAVLLVVCLFSSYIIYQIVLASKSEIETQFALKETVYKTIDTKCFVIRDEEFIKNSAGGTTVSFATNGERIARGDTVSIIFDSVEDASSYLKINELKKRIEHFQDKLTSKL